MRKNGNNRVIVTEVMWQGWCVVGITKRGEGGAKDEVLLVSQHAFKGEAEKARADLIKYGYGSEDTVLVMKTAALEYKTKPEVRDYKKDKPTASAQKGKWWVVQELGGFFDGGYVEDEDGELARVIVTCPIGSFASPSLAQQEIERRKGTGTYRMLCLDAPIN